MRKKHVTITTSNEDKELRKKLKKTILENVSRTVDNYFANHGGEYDITDIDVEISFHKEEKTRAYAKRASPKVPWIKNGRCINEKKQNICNLGYACDGCPWNKDKEKKL